MPSTNDPTEWADKRRAAIARAEEMRAARKSEEERRRAREMRAEGECGSEAPGGGDRHLPTCQCGACISRNGEPPVPASPPIRPPPNAFNPPEPQQSNPFGGKTRDPHEAGGGWDNDFTDGGKGGFDQMWQNKQLAAKRKARLEEKKKQDARRVQSAVGGPPPSEPPPQRNRVGSAPKVVPKKQAPPPSRVVQKKQPVTGGGGGGGGGKEGGPNYRQNFDKRTSRHMHSRVFQAAIAATTIVSEVPDGHVPFQRVGMFVRKRPLLPHEMKKGEYDVVSVDKEKARIVIHNCLMHADMQRKHMNHVSFPSTDAFGGECQNEEVYARVLQPLVPGVGQEGATVTVLMNGQTGSGKTHTMTAMEQMAACDLFSSLPATGRVYMSFFEIAGKSARCLLGGGSEVTFYEGQEGQLQICGAREEEPTSPAECLQLIEEGKSRRATESTSANAVSSRSHAICRICVVHPDGRMGRLVLVDCAGSERKEDSANHTAERRKEGAEINSSLHALKECMRALKNNASYVPYRMHNLTKALKESFESEGARVVVVATVSPTATDTEHSIHTLKTVCEFTGCTGRIGEKKEDVSDRPDYHRPPPPPPIKKPVSQPRTNPPPPVQAAPIAAPQSARSPPSRHSAGSSPGGGSTPPLPSATKNSPPAPRRTGQLSPRASERNQPISPNSRPHSAGSTSFPHPSEQPEQPKTMLPRLAPPSVAKHPLLAHPKEWTVEEAQSWARKTSKCPDLRLPEGQDGKAILRWNRSRWVQFMSGRDEAGTKLFNGLRLQIDKCNEQEKRRRKAFMGNR